jgi:hypothetical protein
MPIDKHDIDTISCFLKNKFTVKDKKDFTVNSADPNQKNVKKENDVLAVLKKKINLCPSNLLLHEIAQGRKINKMNILIIEI